MYFQIYHEGKLLYYIDGHDESKASWMRYIRCARHGNEQNMFAFQYCGNVYYKAFRDIPPGTELLVWYDEKYPQYMGIPLEIRETFRESSSGKTATAVVPCLYCVINKAFAWSTKRAEPDVSFLLLSPFPF